MTKVKAIPEGYHTITPYICVRGAKDAIAYYQKAFGAKEIMSMPDEKTGKICHAELKIGDSMVMLADEFPEMNFLSPQSRGGSPIWLNLYVEDCDDVFKKAVEAGAQVVRPLADQFYGDRSGTITDPFGYSWTIATHKEDLSDEEISARAAKMNCTENKQ